MENEINKQENQLIVSTSIQRKPRFKAGSDLSDAVNVKRMDVEVIDSSTEDAEVFEVVLRLKNSAETNLTSPINS